MLIWDDNGEETVCDVDDQHTDTEETRSAAMSSSFPKSESTTSLLKSSSSTARRATQPPERSAESRYGKDYRDAIDKVYEELLVGHKKRLRPGEDLHS